MDSYQALIHVAQVPLHTVFYRSYTSEEAADRRHLRYRI